MRLPGPIGATTSAVAAPARPDVAVVIDFAGAGNAATHSAKTPGHAAASLVAGPTLLVVDSDRWRGA